MKVLIMGAGSIGTVIGAFMAKNGADVVMVDSFEDNVRALNQNGATVTGTVEFTAPIRAIMPEQMKGIYDLVILITKQTTNEEVLKNLLPHLGENSTVCTLQNGVPEDYVSQIVGRSRTIGGAVGFGATWIEPGVTKLTSTQKVMDQFAFDIGEMDGKMTERIRKVQKLLSMVGHTDILNNLMGVRWAKLLMNATFSGMSAALGCTFGEVLNDPLAIRCVAHIADETIKVARACGIQMEPMQGKDFTQLELNSAADIPGKIPFYHEVWDQHSLLKASMLQDLEKKRQTEIDYINGYVCRKGREHGIDTPFNDMVVAVVRTEETCKTVNTQMTALKQFKVLLDLAEQSR